MVPGSQVCNIQSLRMKPHPHELKVGTVRQHASAMKYDTLLVLADGFLHLSRPSLFTWSPYPGDSARQAAKYLVWRSDWESIQAQ
jgi:hypothetical protein